MYTEEKLDGERYIIHSDVGGQYKNACTSRRESEVTGKMVVKTDRVPHIMKLTLPPVSLLDCEFVSSGDVIKLDLPGKFWDKMDAKWHLDYLPVYPTVANTVSIMGSLSAEAIRKQEERGYIQAYCFDIVMYDGKYTTHNKQSARRKFLRELFESINPSSNVLLMPQFVNLTPNEIEELFYLVTDIKGEGLILKDPTKPYDHASAWYKLKIDYPADVVYTGNCKIGEYGQTGKMEGLASSLEIGVYHQGRVHALGWISAIRDGEAGLQTPEDHYNTYAGKAVEVRHNGLQAKPDAPLGFTLRHPRFRRDRSNDKNGTDCTWEILKAETEKGIYK
jgi:ATP-dependent DNA ligase